MQNIGMAIIMMALLFVATLQQIRDIKKGSKAAGLSFLIWTAVDGVSVMAQAVTHPAPIAMVLPVGQLTSMALICLVAFKTTPTLGRTDHFQRMAIVLCVLGLSTWLLLGNPLYALLGNVVANLAGALPTWEQVWRHPRTVSSGFWSICGSAAACGLVVAAMQTPLHIASIIPQLTGVFVCGSILMVRYGRMRLPRQSVLEEMVS